MFCEKSNSACISTSFRLNLADPEKLGLGNQPRVFVKTEAIGASFLKSACVIL